VDRVLHLLSQLQIFLKQYKCSFGALEIEYLGHIIGKVSVRVDPKKIEAMQDWPHPRTLKILHGFLGLTGYYVMSPLWDIITGQRFMMTRVARWVLERVQGYLRDIVGSILH
jgi:hypothetical protein